MTTTNDWIKMSDRKPTEADLPVWAESPKWVEPEKPRLIWSLSVLFSPNCIPARSWKTARDIPAPPKEQTQRERDEAAFKEFCEDTEAAQHNGACSPSWHAALAWERAEIAKLISETIPATWSKEPSYYFPGSIMDKLRARLRP